MQSAQPAADERIRASWGQRLETPSASGIREAGPARLLRRGAHRSVRALNAGIETRNDDPEAFVWAKTADQILDPIAR